MSAEEKYITNIGRLISPLPFEPGLNNCLQSIDNCSVKVFNGKIEEVIKSPQPEDSVNAEVFDAGGMVMTPGFVDSHTHPVFMATRENEFVMRSQGKTYQDIAAAGGGIVSSIKSVREASLDELTGKVRRHFDGFLRQGITTIEAKSGYGLSAEAELKSLQAIKLAAKGHPLNVSPTLLAAHVVPPEFKSNPDDYVKLVCEELIPETAKTGLAQGVDVFLDSGAYNIDQAKRIFRAGNKAGLNIHLHANQFQDDGGAELAIECGATTIDHADYTSIQNYRRLAENGVIVNLLPGSVFFLGLTHYAPGSQIVEAGCQVALSTDFNPGSTPSQSMSLMLTLACIYMKLEPEQALWAATIGGAKALKLEERYGAIEKGFNADLCLWEVDNLRQIPYFYASKTPVAVWKGGRTVIDDRK